MDKFKVRKRAYTEGARFGFIAGVIFSAGVVILVLRAKQDSDAMKYTFIHQ
jgi:hypothetical protein